MNQQPYLDAHCKQLASMYINRSPLPIVDDYIDDLAYAFHETYERWLAKQYQSNSDTSKEN